MGTSAWRSRSLQKTLLASSSAAARRGPKTRSPASSKASTMPAASGASGPTTRQPHVVLLGEADQGGEVGRLDVDVLAVEIGAGVAGGHEDAVGAGTLRDFPGQGVFPPPIADDQDVHAKAPYFRPPAGNR